MRIGFLFINWTDVLDILLVSFLLYQVYILVKGSIASRVFLGYLFVYVFYLVVKGLRLELLTAILQYFMGVGAIALIVIFQQEIRRFLLIIGKSTAFTNNRFFNTFLGSADSGLEADNLKTIVEACRSIASDFNGALIVIKKKDDLDKYVQTGTPLDALISKPLLAVSYTHLDVYKRQGYQHQKEIVQGGYIRGEHFKVFFQFDLCTYGVVEFDQPRKDEKGSDDDFGYLSNAFHFYN